MSNLVGQTISQYRIEEQIGRGGMAKVYKAFQPSMKRYVAIKILSESLAEDPDFVRRFRREAEAIAQLDHPHILSVYDAGEENGLMYLVMRYIDTGTLTRRLKKPIDEVEVVRLLGQVAEALDYTHHQGIVHRDIKPSNILIDTHGAALLTDFGIAKMVEGTEGLTRHGFVGTVTYISPEQAQGGPVDRRSDIYSLGVVLYEALVGDPPLEKNPLPPPRSIKPQINPALEQVILKALAHSPADRYQTANEMKQAMQLALISDSSSFTDRSPGSLPGVDSTPSPTPTAWSMLNQLELPRNNQLILRIGGLLLIIACSLCLFVGPIFGYLQTGTWFGLSQETTTPPPPTFASSIIITGNTGPVVAGDMINSQIIGELTIQAGDPPEVKKQKAEQRAKLIASVISEYIRRIDARLGLVETALKEDEFDQQLNQARATVAPSMQESFEADYQKLITTEKINSLRQQFNTYPLPTGPEPLVSNLVAESEVEPVDVTFFYNQLVEVQHASEALLDDLSLITKQAPDEAAWRAYSQQRINLAVDVLQNNSDLAHIAGLMILNDLPAAQPQVITSLAGLTHLQPSRLVDDTEAATLLTQLSTQKEALNQQRLDLLKKDQELRDQLLEEYKSINQEELAINPDDSWDIVVGKAITLRHLGQIDQAVAAFSKYETMFAETDPTAKQYARAARLFTRQIGVLAIENGAVYIYEVVEDSPAAAAGLKVGDIVIEFNGQSVTNMVDFQTALDTKPKDKPIELFILRLDEQGIFQRQTVTISAQDSPGIGAMPI